ncbi:unnamed protein product [Durusdinium trenchii]|uniref:Uncharacterized protein n=1 Tax=Durusdinium trenchii TaxID=1381693 RepID=A0ABP0HP30_9DINO
MVPRYLRQKPSTHLVFPGNVPKSCQARKLNIWPRSSHQELAKDLESMGTLQLYVHNNEIGKEGVEALEEVQARRRASGQTNFKVQELGVQQLEEEKFEEKPRKHRKKRRILFVGKKKCGQTSAEIESGEREVA